MVQRIEVHPVAIPSEKNSFDQVQLDQNENYHSDGEDQSRKWGKGRDGCVHELIKVRPMSIAVVVTVMDLHDMVVGRSDKTLAESHHIAYLKVVKFYMR